MIRALLGFLIAFATAVAPVFGSELRPHPGEVAFVNSPDSILNLRASPSASATLILPLPQKTRVQIIQSFDNGWMKVAVEIMGDTGQRPAQSLVGFVNGRFLVVNKYDSQIEYAAMKRVMERYMVNPPSHVNIWRN